MNSSRPCRTCTITGLRGSREDLDNRLQWYNYLGQVTGAGYHSFEQFNDLMHSEVEAVAIATPPETHYSLVAQALASGKHVFVEKPLTTNYGCLKLSWSLKNNYYKLHIITLVRPKQV